MQNSGGRSRARAAGVVALALATALVSMWSLLSASAAGTNAGAAQVVDPSSGQPLTSGGSSTSFTLKLPQGAACTGDSATGQYKVQSYMVPSTVDPGTLQFGSAGPTPAGTGASFRQPLYDTNGSPYVNAQTANATTAGGPGPIINIPTFNFAVYSPGDIPPGTYNLGIACTLGPASTTQEDKYWNVQLTFTTDANDSPAQIHWVVTPTGVTTSSTVAAATTSTTTGATTSTTTGATTSTTTAATTSTTIHSTTSTTTGATTSTTTHPTTTSTTTPTSTTSTTTGSTTTTTTGSTTTTTTGSGPGPGPSPQELRHEVRCEVLSNLIDAFDGIVNNDSLPPEVRDAFSHHLDRLERRADRANCDLPMSQPATAQPAGQLAPSRRAQAVPMQVAPVFLWFGPWL